MFTSIFILYSTQVLRVWKTNNAFKATYKQLATVALNLGDSQTAMRVCELCKGTMCSVKPLLTRKLVVALRKFPSRESFLT